MIKIEQCPICGNETVDEVKQTLKREIDGHPYEVPNVRYQHCRSCGESFFDREASRQIDQASPKFKKLRTRASA